MGLQYTWRLVVTTVHQSYLSAPRYMCLPSPQRPPEGAHEHLSQVSPGAHSPPGLPPPSCKSPRPPCGPGDPPSHSLCSIPKGLLTVLPTCHTGKGLWDALRPLPGMLPCYLSRWPPSLGPLMFSPQPRPSGSALYQLGTPLAAVRGCPILLCTHSASPTPSSRCVLLPPTPLQRSAHTRCSCIPGTRHGAQRTPGAET